MGTATSFDPVGDERAARSGGSGEGPTRRSRDVAKKWGLAGIAACLLLAFLPGMVGTASAVNDGTPIPEDSIEIPWTRVQEGPTFEIGIRINTFYYTSCEVAVYADLDPTLLGEPNAEGNFEVYHERLWTAETGPARIFEQYPIEPDGRYRVGHYGALFYDPDEDGIDEITGDGVDCEASDFADITSRNYEAEHRFFTLSDTIFAADFEFDITDPTTGEVAFTSTAREPDDRPLDHAWDFGDGEGSAAEDPVHTYAAPGDYSVTLTVTDPDGNQESRSRLVDVAGNEVQPELSVVGTDPGDPVELTIGEETDVRLDLTATDDGYGDTFAVQANDIVPVRFPANVELVDGPEVPYQRDIAAGDTVSYVFTVRATEEGDGTIGTEWYGNDAGGGQFGPNRDDLPFTVKDYELDVDLESAPTKLMPGEEGEVTLTVTNGLTETAVDDIATTLDLDWTPAESGGEAPELGELTPAGDIATLAPGASVELTASVTAADAAGSIALTAEAAGTRADDGEAIDASARLRIEVEQPPLLVEIEADPTTTPVDEDVALTVAVTNTTDAEIVDVSVELEQEWDAAAGDDEPELSAVDPTTLSSLAAGATAEFTATFTGSGPGVSTVTARAGGDEPIIWWSPPAGDGPTAAGGAFVSNDAEVEITVVGELTVNSDGDAADDDPGDGACDTGSTVSIEGEDVAECTLRAAIQEGNEREGGVEIGFDVPGGVPTIAVQSPLPAVQGPAAIDGSTQPDGRVALDGSGAGGEADGLVLEGSNVTVRGLSVGGFGGAGVVLAGDGSHAVVGNLIGVGPDGSSAAGNTGGGVTVASPGNTVGGDGADANTIAHSGEEPSIDKPEPGTKAGTVEGEAVGTKGNVTVGDGGGATIAGNQVGDGIGLVAEGDLGPLSIDGNHFEGAIGIIAVPSAGTAAALTISGNTFGGGSDDMGVGLVLAKGGTGAIGITGNEFDDVALPVLAAGVPTSASLDLSGNTITGGGIGAIALSVSGATVSDNEIEADMGILSLGDASSSDGHNTYDGNTLDTKIGFVIAGENETVVSDNEVPGGAAGALFVANSEMTTSGNELGSKLGIISIGPGLPAFGHNRYEGNAFSGEVAGLLIAGEDANEVVDNTFTDNAVGMLVSTSQASHVEQNTVTGAEIGLILINVGGAEIRDNSVTGAKLGAIVAAGEPEEQQEQAEAGDVKTSGEELFGAAFDGELGDAAVAWANGAQDVVEIDPTTIYRSPVSGARNIWTGNTISDNDVGLVVGGEVNANEFGGATPALANRITGNSALGMVFAGVPGPQDVTIRGNVISGNGTAGKENIPAGAPDLKLYADQSDDPPASAFQPLANDPLDADTGPNGLQNHPVIQSVAGDGSSVSGELWSEPSRSYLVDLYAASGCHPSGYGGADRYLGEVAVSTDGAGRGTFTKALALAPGEVVTATATPTGAFADGGTSEFSRCASAGQVGTTITELAEEGDTEIEVASDEGFEIGDEVIINAGGETEETGVVADFGSIILEDPVEHDHRPGETLAVSTVPGAPTAVTASSCGTASITVSWTAPVDDGGSPITGYTVTPSVDGVAQTPVTFDSTATAQQLSGLAPGAATFTVAAVNAVGTGAASAVSTAASGVDPVVSDFDANGKTNVGVWRPSDGSWHVEGTARSFSGLEGDVPVPAAYACDAKTTKAVWRPSTGAWIIGGQPTVHFGIEGDVPVPADYDGDGDVDRAVFRPASGTWFVEGSAPSPWGLPGDVPVPADYDGDGDAEIAVFRPSTGAWHIQSSPGTGSTQYFGVSGDVPVPGQYDADPALDLAVFRPSSGAWFVDGAATRYLGFTGDVAVPGQYDADPQTDIAVFRPSSGAWFIETGTPATHYGLPGDIPTPRRPTS